MRILVLVAGTSEPSNCDTLADAFIEGMKDHTSLAEGELRGARVGVTKLRLKDLQIEHFDLGYYNPHCTTEDDFCRLQELFQSAGGVVIATPIWNFGVPAHLKNLIDRMGSFALDAELRRRGMLGGKPFFLLFTGGSPTAAWKGLQRRTTSFLPTALRYFGGTIFGMHYEGWCMAGKGKFGLVVHERPKTLAHVRAEGRKFAEQVSVFAETGKLPLKQALLYRVYQWGQVVLARVK